MDITSNRLGDPKIVLRTDGARATNEIKTYTLNMQMSEYK